MTTQVLRIGLLIIYNLICIAVSSHNPQSFFVEYNPICHTAYDLLADLKLDDAKKLIHKSKAEEPYNLAWVHLENYLDFFELFINEDKEAFERLQKSKNKRIRLIKKKLPDNDPYKNFLLAEINLQWALVRSKFGEYFTAGREVYMAYNLLIENNSRFPDFIYNLKSLSLMHSLIETITIPGVVKTLFGIEGSIEQGRQEIEALVEYTKTHKFIFKKEVDAIYGFILFFQCNEQDLAKRFVEQSSLDPHTSLAATFVHTKLAQRSGHNDRAIDILKNKPEGDAYASFHYLSFLEGLSLLRNMDESAIPVLEDFVQSFNGRHYIKEAYQKLGWAHLIFHNDTLAYRHNMQMVLNNGHASIDDDKQAQREAESGRFFLM